MRLGRVSVETLGVAAVLAAVLLAIPLVTDEFYTFQFANVAVFVIALVGLNVLTGYNGQISLGNGAFMAVGGYTTALLARRYFDLPYWVTVPLGGLVAGFAGYLFGLPALRLRGIYLALATFALALSLTPVLNNFDSFTGGHAGIVLHPVRPPSFIDMSQEQWLYFVYWLIAIALYVPAWLMVRARTGRAWMAIRDSETAAVASGISLPYYKTLAFGISAFYAGIAGSLQVIANSYINPDGYGLALSLQLLIGIVVGGLGLTWGPVFGGLLVVWLPYLAERAGGIHLGPLLTPQKPDIGFGVLLILIVFFASNGVAGLLDRGLRRYRTWRRVTRGVPAPVAAAAEPEVAPVVGAEE